MYIRSSALLPITALVAVVAAAPGMFEVRSGSQCNTGSIQCCDSTSNSNDETVTSLTGTLGIVLPTVEGLVGLGCTPILLGNGATCNQQPVCCTGNSFNGLINVGCSPINLSL